MRTHYDYRTRGIKNAGPWNFEARVDGIGEVAGISQHMPGRYTGRIGGGEATALSHRGGWKRKS